jgi:catalase
VTEAYTFELGKVYEQAIKERVLTVLARIDTELCEKVAAGLGLPVPEGKPADHLPPSPALAQVKGETFPIAGRRVGVLAGPRRRPVRDRRPAQLPHGPGGAAAGDRSARR